MSETEPNKSFLWGGRVVSALPAVATHVRVGDPFGPPLILGILVWLGLFLRDARVRALLPLRK